MQTSSKRVLGVWAEDSSCEPGPTSEPQSGTVLRRDMPSESDDEPTAKLPPTLARTILLEHLAEYCATWPDQPHPALNGETPRKIVATADGRARVDALVRELEQQAEGTLIGDACDFEGLRFDLGLGAR